MSQVVSIANFHISGSQTARSLPTRWTTRPVRLKSPLSPQLSYCCPPSSNHRRICHDVLCTKSKGRPRSGSFDMSEVANTYENEPIAVEQAGLSGTSRLNLLVTKILSYLHLSSGICLPTYSLDHLAFSRPRRRVCTPSSFNHLPSTPKTPTITRTNIEYREPKNIPGIQQQQQ